MKAAFGAAYEKQIIFGDVDELDLSIPLWKCYSNKYSFCNIRWNKIPSTN